MNRFLVFLVIIGGGLSAVAQVVNQEQVVTVTGGAALWVQTDLTNRGDVANDGQIRIVGNLRNENTLDNRSVLVCSGNATNTGRLNNDQLLLLRGDWQNTGTYQPGSAERFVLMGNNQTVGHGGQSFNRLVVRNGGDKTFAQSATVAQQLVLGEGLLTPMAGTDFLLAGEAIVDSASQDSYVNGRLLRQGTAARLYPVGRNGTYAPMLLLAEEGAETNSDAVIVAAEVMSPGTSEVDASLSRISTVRVWQTQAVRGTTNARVGLSVLPDEEIVIPDSTVVAYAPDANTPFTSLGQSQVRMTAAVPALGSFKAAGAGRLALGVLSSPDKSGLVYVPNAFAPSSAHEEERVFKLYGVNIASEGLELVVYNRWGNVVFKSRSYEQITRTGWDGRNQATQADEPPGVYTYALRGTLDTGRSIQRTGTVTLLR